MLRPKTFRFKSPENKYVWKLDAPGNGLLLACCFKTDVQLGDQALNAETPGHNAVSRIRMTAWYEQQLNA